MVVRDTDAALQWQEYHDRIAAVDDASAQRIAQQLIASFNATLRAHEHPRTLISAVIAGPTIGGQHEWRKASLVTEKGREGYYDRMECEACGVTAKRFGLSGGVVFDKPYRSVIYHTCTPAPQQQPQQSQPLATIEQQQTKEQELELTQWFNTKEDGPPARAGLYQTKTEWWRWYFGEENTGPLWSIPTDTAEGQINPIPDKPPHSKSRGAPRFWRGLASDPQQQQAPKRERKRLIADEPEQAELPLLTWSRERKRLELAEEE